MSCLNAIRTTRPVSFKWSSEYYFKIAIYCWTVGLNSSWSYPIMMNQELGGFLFYIPCSIIMVFYSIPIGYLELALGQFCVQGPLGIWRLCRGWRGTGIAALLISAISVIYYQTSAAILLFYVATSWAKDIHWTTCPDEWIAQGCFTFLGNGSIKRDCVTQHGVDYCTHLQWANSADFYFRKEFLDGDQEGAMLKLLVSSAVTIVVVFLCLCRGTWSFEHLLSFLFYTPLLLQVVLLFVSLIHPGCMESFYYVFLEGEWSKLVQWTTWKRAFVETSTSIRGGYGVFFLLGATSPSFRSPVHIIIIMACSMYLSCSIIFALTYVNALGTLSYELNIPVKDILEWPGLCVFGKIPLSIVRWSGIAQVWAAIYFFTLYIFAVRNVMLLLFLFAHAFGTSNPRVTPHFVTAFAAMLCACVFASSVLTLQPWLLPNLEYLYTVVAISARTLVLFFECVGIMWIYGVNHVMDDIYFMLGFRASFYWQICWAVCPLVFLIVFHQSLSMWQTRLPISDEAMMRVVAYVVAFMPALIVIVYACVYWLMHRRKRNFKCFAPAPHWGPVDPVLRKSRNMFSAHSMTKEYIYRQNRLKSCKFKAGVPVVVRAPLFEKTNVNK